MALISFNNLLLVFRNMQSKPRKIIVEYFSIKVSKISWKHAGGVYEVNMVFLLENSQEFRKILKINVTYIRILVWKHLLFSYSTRIPIVM